MLDCCSSCQGKPNQLLGLGSNCFFKFFNVQGTPVGLTLPAAEGSKPQQQSGTICNTFCDLLLSINWCYELWDCITSFMFIRDASVCPLQKEIINEALNHLSWVMLLQIYTLLGSLLTVPQPQRQKVKQPKIKGNRNKEKPKCKIWQHRQNQAC